jgi:hypothetical protein
MKKFAVGLGCDILLCAIILICLIVGFILPLVCFFLLFVFNWFIAILTLPVWFIWNQMVFDWLDSKQITNYIYKNSLFWKA